MTLSLSLSFSLWAHWHPKTAAFQVPRNLVSGTVSQSPDRVTRRGVSRVHAGHRLARYDWLQAILSGIKLYVFMNS